MRHNTNISIARIYTKASQIILFTAAIFLSIEVLREHLHQKVVFLEILMGSCTVFCVGMAIEKLWKLAGAISMRLVRGIGQAKMDRSNLGLSQDLETGVSE